MMTAETQFMSAPEPFALFGEWLNDASGSEPNDPNAMSLATVDQTGMPNVRIVLLKDFDERGFVYYTNFESQKGVEALRSRTAALCFHWKSRRRQVRIRGGVTVVSSEEADAYYATRPLGSRIGAWASRQSRPLESRADLQAAVKAYEAKFSDGNPPRPSCWSGFRVTPLEIEFWQDGEFRLHNRLVFRRASLDGEWSRTRLYP